MSCGCAGCLLGYIRGLILGLLWGGGDAGCGCGCLALVIVRVAIAGAAALCGATAWPTFRHGGMPVGNLWITRAHGA